MNESILTCPECGHAQSENIPAASCLPFYVCDNCGRTIAAASGDCCVFCSYGDKACAVKEKGNFQ